MRPRDFVPPRLPDANLEAADPPGIKWYLLNRGIPVNDRLKVSAALVERCAIDWPELPPVSLGREAKIGSCRASS